MPLQTVDKVIQRCSLYIRTYEPNCAATFKIKTSVGIQSLYVVKVFICARCRWVSPLSLRAPSCSPHTTCCNVLPLMIHQSDMPSDSIPPL